MERSLEKLLIMIVPIHYWELVCREESDGAEKGKCFLPLHFCKSLSIGST